MTFDDEHGSIFGRNPEPWREHLGALRLTLSAETLDVVRARAECEALVAVMNTPYQCGYCGMGCDETHVCVPPAWPENRWES
jgi:hypothetical protein